MPSYEDAPISIVRGKGLHVFDEHDRQYLDFATGVATVPLGHGHPRWVEAVGAQIQQLVHVSNLYGTRPKEFLAQKLVEVAEFGLVFLSNSGAEANEAAFKIARRYGIREGRTRIVALKGAFHGRTYLTLAVGDQPGKTPPFEHRLDYIEHVPPNDVAALTAAVDEETAAVVMEPILGAGGVVPLKRAFVSAARDLCDRHGALLILDEVQTGVGRLGTWFAYQGLGIQPDVVTLSKGIANGLPVGATIARSDLALAPGDHGSNFGGGPVGSIAALTVLQVIEEEHLLENARVQGQRLIDGLERVLAPWPGLGEVRGQGLLVGLALTTNDGNAATLVRALVDRGILATLAGRDVVRFTPPLTVTETAVDDVVESVGAALGQLLPNVVRA